MMTERLPTRVANGVAMRALALLQVVVVLECVVSHCCAADDLPALVADLQDKDFVAQITACEKLAQLGDKAEEALPALIDLLEDGSMESREAAIRAVAAIGPKATSAVPALVLLLRDRRYWVRDEAASALVSIGHAALPHVLRALKSDSPRARAAAAKAAGEMATESDAVVPALAIALNDPDPRVRATAAASLGRLGDKAVPVLAAAVGDKESCVAVAIAESLKKLHAGPAVAMNALAKLLDDPHARLAAVRGLQTYGVEARRAIPALVKAYPAGVEDDFRGGDDGIIEALKHIGPPHIDDVPALEELLRHPKPDVRALAARQLGLMDQLGAGRDRASAALEPALADASAVVRMEAARSLWLLTQDATRVLPVLEGAADGDQYDAIRGVSETLQQIGEPAVPTLVRLLTKEDKTVRWWAAQGLGGIGKAASDALPALCAALSDQDDGVRDAVTRAISETGDAKPPAVPQLIAAVKGGRLSVSQLAVAVTDVGPAAKLAMPLLIEGLESGDESARSRIIEAICSVGADDEGTIDIVNKAIEKGRVRRAWAIDAFARLKGRAAEAAVPTLVETLGSPDDYTRQAAAKTLGQMAAAGKNAIPKLRDATGDKELPVRVQAALALWRLTGETQPMSVAVTNAFHDEIAEGDYNTWYRRRETLEAVGDMGAAAAPLVPTLLTAMKENSDGLTLEFIDVLGKVGSAAQEAIPALVEISQATDWEVRKAALDAIQRIRQERKGDQK